MLDAMLIMPCITSRDLNVLLTVADPSFRHDTGRGLRAVPGLREGGAEAADPQPAQLCRAGHRQGRYQEYEGHHGQEPTRVMHTKIERHFYSIHVHLINLLL